MIEILILYYSRHGAVEAMAQQLARGVESVPGMQASLSFPPPTKAFEGRLRREPMQRRIWHRCYGFPPARERQRKLVIYALAL